MATLIPNEFSSYELSDEEALQGSVFTTTQLQVLQNAKAAVAEEKIHLEYDPENPLLFAQREAGLAGQLATYNYLIDSSAAAADEIANPTPIDLQ